MDIGEVTVGPVSVGVYGNLGSVCVRLPAYLSLVVA